MLTVNHAASASGGSFSAWDGGLRMGDLSYEWASPNVFAIMHTVVEEAFRGQGVAKGRVFSPCRGFYVVVPEEYRLWKAVPLSLGASGDDDKVDKKWKMVQNTFFNYVSSPCPNGFPSGVQVFTSSHFPHPVFL